MVVSLYIQRWADWDIGEHQVQFVNGQVGQEVDERRLMAHQFGELRRFDLPGVFEFRPA